MKAKTQVTVQELTLNSPTARINSVQYNWTNDTALIEVIFQEEGANYKHSKSFVMNTNGNQQTASKIREFVKSELPDFE